MAFRPLSFPLIPAKYEPFHSCCRNQSGIPACVFVTECRKNNAVLHHDFLFETLCRARWSMPEGTADLNVTFCGVSIRAALETVTRRRRMTAITSMLTHESASCPGISSCVLPPLSSWPG
jgi:hypothetical protein